MSNTDYIKNGDRIFPKSKGCDYDLIPGKVYNLKYDNFTGESYLQLNGDLNLPKKRYHLANDDAFIERIITFFNSEESEQTTGVLLSGVKGTGKSVLAKYLAQASNLPIVIPDFEFRARYLNKFFEGLKQPICIIMDEIEKNTYYQPTEEILTFLDGVQASCKKMVIMTCNNKDNLNDNLIDRCSRIRYKRNYTNDSNDSLIKYIIADKGLTDAGIILNFITYRFKVKSFDNINSFLNELKLFHKDENLTESKLEEIVEFMNISINDRIERDEEDDIPLAVTNEIIKDDTCVCDCGC